MIPGFDRFARNLRGGDARAVRHGIYGDVLPGAVVGCDSDRALAMNGGLSHEWKGAMAMNGMRHGHEWNGAMAMNGMRHGHEWNRAMAISGAIHGGHVGGAF